MNEFLERRMFAMKETMTEKQMGSGINPAVLQDVLDSASNAKETGQSQFQTPRAFAKLCAVPLSDIRETITDFNCAAGNLLFTAANKTTKHLLGCDVDNIASKKEEGDRDLHLSRIVGDFTKVFEILVDCKWRTDLTLLNPPYSLHFYKERFAQIAEDPDYENAYIRTAFAARDNSLGGDKIDSTVAMFLCALYLQQRKGEGYLIGNMATLNRLLLSSDAPHKAAATHIWAVIDLKGNPMTGLTHGAWDKEKECRTGVIYFARSHTGGYQGVIPCESMEEFAVAVERLKNERTRRFRGMSMRYEFDAYKDSAELWQGVRDEWNYRQGERKKGAYNVWLEPDGTIGVNLSLFQQRSTKVDKVAASKLNELKGQRPLQLVLQVAQRRHLVDTVKGGLWRVDPKLVVAVDKAVEEYTAVRAPLYPLNPISRIGHLDESNKITCIRDVTRDGKVLFKAGTVYPLRTASMRVERIRWRPNLAGINEEHLLSGQELAIYIKDEAGIERTFLDGRLNAEGVKVGGPYDKASFEFTLNELVEWFEIPEAPDVSVCNPEGYQRNMNMLNEIEQLMNV